MDGNITERAEMPLNQVLFLQAEITHLYMKKHKLTPRQFLELDKKYDILGFLETGYEPFHLTGVQIVAYGSVSHIRRERVVLDRLPCPPPGGRPAPGRKTKVSAGD
jgi:hypothetical protein